MAIEVRIPKEIKEYKEKIMFGLSIRQILCFTIAIVVGVLTYLFLTSVLGLDMDFASYVIMIEVIPVLAVGFVRINGFTFEKYFALFMKHKFGISKRIYETELLIDAPDLKKKEEKPEIPKKSYSWIFENKETSQTDIKEKPDKNTVKLQKFDEQIKEYSPRTKTEKSFYKKRTSLFEKITTKGEENPNETN